MNLSQLLIFAGIVYVCNVFLLVWLSLKFVGHDTITAKLVALLGTAIVLVSWLTASALLHAPLFLKPMMVLIGCIILIVAFIVLLDPHRLKAITAGTFYVVCQFLVIVLLLRQIWRQDLFEIVKYLLFQH
ncbi:MAG: hypothetical protein SCK70_15495 [bacterium]|nr:hypothetical protein [bacterium]